jgi:ankyrin repeat protein
MASLIDYVFQNNLEGLKASLAQGSDTNQVDSDGRTPLIQAAIDNRLEVAKLLLESGANVNAQDALGNSALHYAAQEYHCEMAMLLLGNGASVDMQDKHGNTPLWRAVFNSRGRGEVIAILLKAGADKSHRNRTGKTPLELTKTIANYNIAGFFD